MITGVMFAVAALISLIVIWVTEGMFKREAPFGVAADYVIGLIAGVGVAALDYYVFVPMFFTNAAEWLRLVAAITEGPFCAWLILWIIRQIARPPLKTQAE